MPPERAAPPAGPADRDGAPARHEPAILSFDTSAAHCAAALIRGRQVLASQCEEMTRGQSERLFPLLRDTLALGGMTWDDLDAIGVGIGPGNFTGIRISVAAARGLALSLGVPAIGVGALEAQALDSARPLLSLLDARRGEIYAQSFSQDADQAPGLFPAAQLPRLLQRTAEAGGGGGPVNVVAAAALAEGPEGAPLRADGVVIRAPAPLAPAIGRIVLCRLGASHPRPAPLYLRAADAAPAADTPPAVLP